MIGAILPAHRQFFEGGKSFTYGHTRRRRFELRFGAEAAWESEGFGLTEDRAEEGAQMAAVLGTLTNNQVGDSHRAQEKEGSQWEFSTPAIQEVSLPVGDPTSPSVSHPAIQSPMAYIPLIAYFPDVVASISHDLY